MHHVHTFDGGGARETRGERRLIPFRASRFAVRAMSSDDDSSDEDELFARARDALDVRWSDDEDGAPSPLKLAKIGSDSEDAEDAPSAKPEGKAAVVTSREIGRATHEDVASPSGRGERRKRSEELAPLASDSPERVDGGGIFRSRALLERFGGLAQPPPAYVPMAQAAEVVDDESDDNDDDVREIQSDDDADVQEVGGPDEADEDADMIEIVFQLPNGEKFPRRVGRKWTFQRVIQSWQRSADWSMVSHALGDAAGLRIVCDGDIVRGGDTPASFDLEDGDTLDLVKPAK